MDCWNRIGVLGDKSCGELSVYDHCRDCPTYRSEAVRLLDALTSDERLDEETSRLAREKPPADRAGETLVIFRLGGTWLALSCAVVQEVVGSRAIHSIPYRRNGMVLGLANIGGELVACLSLQAILDLQEPPGAAGVQPDKANPRILVTQQDGGTRLAYPVDEVFGIARLHPDDYVPPPPLITKAANSFTKAVLSWQGNPVSLLDALSLTAAANRSLASATAI